MADTLKKGKNAVKTKRPPPERLMAVIDIGSNSVRLVVFRGLSRLPETVFNERVLCGLGRDVTKSGRMDRGSMALALATLRRFAELCADMKVDDIEAVATAAVRDAGNGPEFIDRIATECGFEVQVLSGEQEAQFSAFGVLCGIPDADGIVGDLGGGSLELAHLKEGKVEESVSLPIGPLRLMAGRKTASPDDLDKIRDAITGVRWLQACCGHNFYLVGGAWRTIARLHMIHRDAPLTILQGYQISGDEMVEFSDLVAGQNVESLASTRSIPGRRLMTLPLAARTLRELLAIIKPEKVVVSALGVREGVQYKKLNHAARLQDPLLFVCKRIADRTGRFPEHADRLMAWIDPVFKGKSEPLRRLRYATCLLSDVSWRRHPDFRAESAYFEALHGRFVSVGHRDRALMAYALFLCYGGPKNDPFTRPARRLLTKKERAYATVLGLALRLGHRLTGGTSRPLGYSRLSLRSSMLTLHLPKKYRDLAGITVMNRLNSLASALDANSDVKLSSD